MNSRQRAKQSRSGILAPMLQFGPKMDARLFFGILANSRGCGELPFPGPRADSQKRSDLRPSGKLLPVPRFRAGDTAWLTRTHFPILVFGASPPRVTQRLVIRARVRSIGLPPSFPQRVMTLLLSSHQTARKLPSCRPAREIWRSGYVTAMVR